MGLVTPSADRRVPMSALAVAGAAGFWLANLAVSLTPLAADYRAAMSIAYLPMLVEAFVGGLAISSCVSFGLVRFGDRIRCGSPITKSLMLSLVALVVVTLLVEVPAKFTTTTDPLRYFLVATLINGIRMLAMGLVIGSLYGRLERHPSTRRSRRTARGDRGATPAAARPAGRRTS